MIISSSQNATYKRLRQLRDRKEQSDLLFLEGSRLCEDALRVGLLPVNLIYVSEKEALAQHLCERFSVPDRVQHIVLSPSLFDRLCMTQQPQGIAMIVSTPPVGHGRPDVSDDALFFICESIRDPGNLGNIMRLADAFMFSALIMIDSVDPFNDKVVRASMGACFRVPLHVVDDIGPVISHLKENGVQLVATSPNGDDLRADLLCVPCACLLGSEAHGLSDVAQKASDRCVRIPMPGEAESLNVASAAAIMGYLLSERRAMPQKKMQAGG